MKYARVERERRFLLDGLPPDVRDPRRIDDLYVDGTTLRLRRVDDGVHKLGQKIRPEARDPSVVHHTTMYLSPEEYAVLVAALSGRRLSKTRWSWDVDGRTWWVDEIIGVGVLAEIELSGPDDAVDAPPGAVVEVTHDERYCGGAMAR